MLICFSEKFPTYTALLGTSRLLILEENSCLHGYYDLHAYLFLGIFIDSGIAESAKNFLHSSNKYLHIVNRFSGFPILCKYSQVPIKHAYMFTVLS